MVSLLSLPSHFFDADSQTRLMPEVTVEVDADYGALLLGGLLAFG